MLDAPWAKMYRRKALADLRFNEALNYAEDKLFVFEFLASCKSILTCPQTVYNYYLRPGSLGSDIRSDRHIAQLQSFLPLYADLLSKLNARYPSSIKVASLYHKDIVGRYVCRILNILATRRTEFCNKEFIGSLYSIMRADKELGMFSVRMGQAVNMMLFKIGNPSLSAFIYRFTSGVVSCFKKKK